MRCVQCVQERGLNPQCFAAPIRCARVYMLLCIPRLLCSTVAATAVQQHGGSSTALSFFNHTHHFFFLELEVICSLYTRHIKHTVSMVNSGSTGGCRNKS